MYGTHATDCRETGRVRRWPGRIRDAGGSRTHLKLLCRQPPYRLAPAPSHSVSSPGVEPGPRPSQGRVRSATLRGHVSFQRPAEESNLVRQFRGLPCHPAHPQGFIQVSRPGLEPGSGPSEGPMRSLAPSRRFQQHPDLESNQVQGFRKALCDPLHHRDKQTRADDWICTSIERFTGPPPFSIEPRRQSSRSARIRTPSGGFGGRFLSQEDTPVSAPGLATGDRWRNNYSFSVTFQYASLMNFDQLSIRMLWSA